MYIYFGLSIRYKSTLPSTGHQTNTTNYLSLFLYYSHAEESPAEIRALLCTMLYKHFLTLYRQDSQRVGEVTDTQKGVRPA